jgi:hypothetical protein
MITKMGLLNLINNEYMFICSIKKFLYIFLVSFKIMKF